MATGVEPRHAATRVERRAEAGAKKSKRSEVSFFNSLAHIALAVWAIVVIAPLVWTVLASFKSNTEIFIGSPFALPKSFGFDAFGRAWSKAQDRKSVV